LGQKYLLSKTLLVFQQEMRYIKTISLKLETGFIPNFLD